MTGARFLTPLLLAGLLTVRPVSAAVGVVVNEVVTDPQSDWNDVTAPFDETPGVGSVTADDEWIEIVNASGEVVDLSDWTLEMRDTSPVTIVLSSPDAPTILVFSTGSTADAFQPGGRLVVGNPPGDMLNDVYLVLRDATSAIVDDVEIGDDPATDGVGDGAPAPGLDGNANSLADEAIARVPNAIDSGVDVDDFDQQAATIGAANSGPPAVLVNEIVCDPQQDWDDDGGTTGTPFDEVPGVSTPENGDEWIELYNASPYVVNIEGWQVLYQDASPETLLLSAPGVTTVRCSPGSLTTALQPGGYVVIGDAPGFMDHDVLVVLLDAFAAIADDVEIGDDPETDGGGDGAPAPGENGDATGIPDEAIARHPNGVDTGDDGADFVRTHATIGTENAPPVSVSSPPLSSETRDIEVHPHPVRDKAELALRLPEPCRLELTVHDALGREVSRQALPTGADVQFAWVAPSRSGVYWIRVRGVGESGRRHEFVRQVTVVR